MTGNSAAAIWLTTTIVHGPGASRVYRHAFTKTLETPLAVLRCTSCIGHAQRGFFTKSKLFVDFQVWEE